MTFVAINHQHPVKTFRTQPGMFIKMPNPFQAGLIVCPSIRCGSNNPVIGNVRLGKPIGKIVSALNDKKW